MDSKLVKKWIAQGVKPSNFEFFTNRPNLVMGKIPGQDAEVEYICEKCGNQGITTVQMGKGIAPSGKQKRKFDRPIFSCGKCGQIIKVPELKKVKS